METKKTVRFDMSGVFEIIESVLPELVKRSGEAELELKSVTLSFDNCSITLNLSQATNPVLD
jgi:hypothetical protein